jgi:hypothetical protein
MHDLARACVIMKFTPMFVWYISECTISKINVNNDMMYQTHKYQYRNTNQILLFGGYVEVRESLCMVFIIWVQNIQNHIDTTTIVPRREGSCVVYTRYIIPNDIKDRYNANPTSINFFFLIFFSL